MEVKLKISADAVFAIDKLLQDVYSVASFPQAQDAKLFLSISYDLSDKFNSKSRSIVKKQTLFNEKKKYSFSLKFHESFALEKIIYASLDNVTNDHQRSILKPIADSLNQKHA